ncbi:hypothetical protein NIES2100_35350 [Calothrix sp. NIES-2100]|uniref:hypothetical protein n=1 Tax=Calothrix sp. NIES-2100 TaxID=1954172 RepID=UPI000B5F16AB|nr:hypothetical protein NIES2100_35350 [Calothrix sp. NIES-2100]
MITKTLKGTLFECLVETALDALKESDIVNVFFCKKENTSKNISDALIPFDIIKVSARINQGQEDVEVTLLNTDNVDEKYKQLVQAARDEGREILYVHIASENEDRVQELTSFPVDIEDEDN